MGGREGTRNDPRTLEPAELLYYTQGTLECYTSRKLQIHIFPESSLTAPTVSSETPTNYVVIHLDSSVYGTYSVHNCFLVVATRFTAKLYYNGTSDVLSRFIQYPGSCSAIHPTTQPYLLLSSLLVEKACSYRKYIFSSDRTRDKLDSSGSAIPITLIIITYFILVLFTPISTLVQPSDSEPRIIAAASL